MKKLNIAVCGLMFAAATATLVSLPGYSDL